MNSCSKMYISVTNLMYLSEFVILLPQRFSSLLHILKIIWISSFGNFRAEFRPGVVSLIFDRFEIFWVMDDFHVGRFCYVAELNQKQYLHNTY